MRAAIPILILAVLSFSTSSVSAGPTCEDRAGEAVRCEDARAMPLGWTLPLEERLDRPPSGPPEPTPAQLGGVFALIGLLFVLIALMPDFDGWRGDASDDEDEVGDRKPGS